MADEFADFKQQPNELNFTDDTPSDVAAAGTSFTAFPASQFGDQPMTMQQPKQV